MTFYLFTLLTVFFVFQATADENAIEKNPSIRVRLETHLKKIIISGQGIKTQGQDRDFQTVAIPTAQELKISRVLIHGKKFWHVEKKVFNATSRIELISAPLLAIEGQQLSLQIKALPSQIFISDSKEGMDVIGVMPLENYLVGVLASEMPLSWPMESLKAQAIAARSYSLATIAERKKNLFHVESSILDQVFRHVSQGVDQDPLIAKAYEAVKQTEGMVLLGPQKKVLKAYYHADCGGQTSSAKSVWGYGESGPGAIDVGCPANPRAAWQLELSQKALTQKLAKILSIPTESVLVAALEPIKITPEQRAEQVKITLNNGQEKFLLADKLRAQIGYGELRSTKFEVAKTTAQDETMFSFRGQGFGHGVGLCQWGSRVMAQQKKSYQEILGHYYPRSSIQ